jgi:hypothetical protein
MNGRVWIAALLMGCATTVSAQSLDFSLSNDSALLDYSSPLQLGGFGRSSWDVSFLYKDNDIGDDNVMGGLGLMVAGDAGTDAPGLEFGAGFKMFVADVAIYDVSALTLHGLVRYAHPAYSRFFMAVELDYSPDIVTFQDGERFLGTAARFGYEILPEADIYVGYRSYEVDIENGPDVDIEQGGHVGLRLTF